MEMGDQNTDLNITFSFPLYTNHRYKNFTSATSFDINSSKVSSEWDPASLYIDNYDFETHRREKCIDILEERTDGTKKIVFRAKFEHPIWWTLASRDKKFLWVIETDKKSWSRFHAIDMTTFNIVCIYHENNLYNEVYVEKDHFIAIYNTEDQKVNRVQFKDIVGE